MKVFSNMLTSGNSLPDGPTMDQRISFDFTPSSIFVFSLLLMDFSDDGVCKRQSDLFQLNCACGFSKQNLAHFVSTYCVL